MSDELKTDRTRLRRAHERGSYDRESLDAVLDATPLCTVGYVFDGQPYSTPTLHWREGDHLYWHGSSASRMLRTVDKAQVCLSVSILDGFVIARSGFHHSINYRSAIVLGEARKVEDVDEMESRLKVMMDGLFPGRWETLRPNTAQECSNLQLDTILRLAIDVSHDAVQCGQ